MENRHKLFLVEDDLNFGGVLKSYLEMDVFDVTWVDDGKNAIPVFKEMDFAICILDVMLPNQDGFTIARKIKELKPSMPLIFLTAKTLKADMLQGYQIGADDYITKPFDSELLLYKLKAVIKRGTADQKSNENEIYQIGKYQFNYFIRQINLDQNNTKLSPKEADLLKMLYLAKNKVLSRTDALISIWGDDNYFTTRSMDVYISKLRKYLKEDPNVELENIHSSGYRLMVKE